MDTSAEPFQEPPSPSPSPPPRPQPLKNSITSLRSPWLALAAASGACASFQGVFAKLATNLYSTTTELTSSWSSAIATTIGLSSSNRFIEISIRATCFVLNLAFNAFMWVLFTAALTRTSSTTRAAIINTSANFMLTALLGFVIFGERLPPLWWLGAGSLVVGNVIIGRRQEDGDEGGVSGARNGRSAESEGRRNERYRDQVDGAISDGVEMDVKELTGNGQREGETFKDHEEVDFERRGKRAGES